MVEIARHDNFGVLEIISDIFGVNDQGNIIDIYIPQANIGYFCTLYSPIPGGTLCFAYVHGHNRVYMTTSNKILYNNIVLFANNVNVNVAIHTWIVMECDRYIQNALCNI